jgi:hypothetical protein
MYLLLMKKLYSYRVTYEKKRNNYKFLDLMECTKLTKLLYLFKFEINLKKLFFIT